MKSNAPVSLTTNAPSQQILSLQSFLNDQVRILGTVNEPWFVATDVAKVLGITNSSDMTLALDDDDLGVGLTETSVGKHWLIMPVWVDRILRSSMMALYRTLRSVML
jgi:hypothetical protein